MGSSPLPRSFYLRPTAEVAVDLLGRLLVRREGRRRRVVRIVEVEAYLGIEDRAAHTFGGRRTPRVEPMWGEGGHAYVFLVYGMHCCLNVVTREAGTPEAILIRAGEPVAGFGREAQPRLASGPGRLAAALAVDRSHSGVDLVRPGELWLEAGEPVVAEELVADPRIGVDYAGEAAAWPLRFSIRRHPAVSVSPERSRRRRGNGSGRLI